MSVRSGLRWGLAMSGAKVTGAVLFSVEGSVDQEDAGLRELFSCSVARARQITRQLERDLRTSRKKRDTA